MAQAGRVHPGRQHGWQRDVENVWTHCSLFALPWSAYWRIGAGIDTNGSRRFCRCGQTGDKSQFKLKLLFICPVTIHLIVPA